MIAANAVAIDVIHNIGMENYTAVSLDSDLPINPKAWSLDDALAAKTTHSNAKISHNPNFGSDFANTSPVAKPSFWPKILKK